MTLLVHARNKVAETDGCKSDKPAIHALAESPALRTALYPSSNHKQQQDLQQG